LERVSEAVFGIFMGLVQSFRIAITVVAHAVA
jgi:hypothetical protein